MEDSTPQTTTEPGFAADNAAEAGANISGANAASAGIASTAALRSTDNAQKAEVSASTIGRMMGLATVSDLKLLDTKMDLVSTKVAGLVVRIEKALTLLNSLPTASDFERIDVQIGSVKTTLRETVQVIQETVAAAVNSKK